MTIQTYDIGLGGIGQITVDSDMPNQGTHIVSGTGFWLRAESGNIKNVYFNYVSSASDADSTGWELAPGEPIQVQVNDLASLFFYTDTIGNKISWMKF